MFVCLHPIIQLEVFNYVCLFASNDSALVVKLCLFVCLHPMIQLELLNYVCLFAFNDSAGVVK